MNKILKIVIPVILLALVPFGARAQEDFKREIESVVFVPKGQFVAGISVSYDQSNQNKYQFLVFEGISGDTYSFKVSPMVCYIVKDDLGVGGKFAYSRSLTKLESADIVLGADNEFNVENLYQLSHNYSAMAIMRNYFSIGRSKRVGFVNMRSSPAPTSAISLSTWASPRASASFSTTIRPSRLTSECSVSNIPTRSRSPTGYMCRNATRNRPISG